MYLIDLRSNLFIPSNLFNIVAHLLIIFVVASFTYLRCGGYWFFEATVVSTSFKANHSSCHSV